MNGHPISIPPSLTRERAHAACQRTCDIHERVRRAADQVSQDIDQLTQPGIPIEISDEDSIVTAVETMIRETKAASGK